MSSDSSLTYPFLQELGLSAENPGVFNGTWFGSGELNRQVRDPWTRTIDAGG
jgi:hypothetical protein